MPRLRLLLLGIGLCSHAAIAMAQQAPLPDDSGGGGAMDEMAEDIVVTGSRPVGSVIGDIPPEVTLSPGDIASYGVSSIADLIAELAPQTASGRGRGESPVVLLGGKRISTFAEIRDIPTEAIQRVEILPEEVALKYGYPANQKVVNIVLRPRFRSYELELEMAGPTEGGQTSPEVELGYLRIGDFGRLNLNMEYSRSSALYESERDVVGEGPRNPDDIVVGVADIDELGRYRTLLPSTDAVELNAVYATQIADGVAASFNGSFTYDESDSAQGLAGDRLSLPAANPYSPTGSDVVLYRYLSEFDPLAQESRNLTGHLGSTFSGVVSDWQWTLTANYDHTASRTLTDADYGLDTLQSRLNALDATLDPFARIAIGDTDGLRVNRARSTSNVGNAELVVNGSLFSLPAGDVSTTVKLAGTMADFSSRSDRAGVISSADLSRDTGSGQLSLDLPIASRKRGVLPALGELSLNMNAAYDRLSDFGGLRTFGAGVTWTPIKPVSLIVSLTEDEGAPSIQQLGNPVITTSGVRVFDYIQGTTVDINRLSGGNPGLSADNRRLFKAGVTLKPFSETDLSITANYTSSRVRDPIASFPTATAAIEAAFPERFQRDAAGQLLAIDSRPINFARQNQEQLRWGINFQKQIGTPPQPEPGAWRRQEQRRPQSTGQEGQAQAQQSPQQEGEQPSLRDVLPEGQRPQSGDQPQRQAGERQEQRRDGPPGAGRPGGPGGFGFPRGPGGRGTRLQLAAYHTIHLRDEILVYEGGPVLDLLKGDAIGSSGGQPGHEVQLQAGLTHNGLGARLSGSWQSATTVNGGINGGEPLRFSDLATVNFRLFANLGQQRALVEKMPILRGTRVTFSVTNLFNSRQQVRDLNGDTPVSYQPAYLDPLGRSIRISLRKLFR